jgi:CDP-glycerol glycerophosphotransferase
LIKRYLAIAMVYIFNCLPIKNNKIFLFSYYGSQYGCNPKYITEYILNNYPKGKFDVVWAFNNLDDKSYLTGFRKVKVMSLRYFYELCTSKVIITNFRTTDLFIKRKKQYYIQTWHSSLRLKHIEKDAKESLPQQYIQMAKKDSLKCDLLLSGCEYSTRIFKRAFWYGGEIFEHGSPRNDILFHENYSLRKKVCNQLNIDTRKKIILYAPTFRKGNNLDAYDLDYGNVLTKTANRFGGEWIILVKLHPHLLSKSGQISFGEKVLDVTSYDDIQELLSVADVLITDYSSLMFDYSITKRPCFLYVPDLKEYVQNDRSLYFDIKELPFISANSNQELQVQIEEFNEKQYNTDLSDFLDHIGSFEKGTTNENLLKRLEEVCFSESGRSSYAAKTI